MARPPKKGRLATNPQDVNTERGEGGVFDTPRAKAGRQHALEILNDPTYRDNLKKRMQMGEGGAIEVWIWRIGYGDPQKDEAESDRQKAQFEAMRTALREFLLKNPEHANVLDAQVQGARRVMPRPLLLPATVVPPRDDEQSA